LVIVGAGDQTSNALSGINSGLLSEKKVSKMYIKYNNETLFEV